jgi:hypothetical protein
MTHPDELNDDVLDVYETIARLAEELRRIPDRKINTRFHLERVRALADARCRLADLQVRQAVLYAQAVDAGLIVEHAEVSR